MSAFDWFFWMLTALITSCFIISLCILFLSSYWNMKSLSYHIYEILLACSAYNWSLSLWWTVSYASFFVPSMGSEIYFVLLSFFSWKHLGEVRICLIFTQPHINSLTRTVDHEATWKLCMYLSSPPCLAKFLLFSRKTDNF